MLVVRPGPELPLVQHGMSGPEKKMKLLSVGGGVKELS